MQYDEEHWRRTSVNIFLSSLVASVWEESSSRLPVFPLEPELLDEEPLVVLEFRSLGLLWWNSVAVVVLLSSCKSSAFETISAALEGRRLPFYDLCWINCFECLLHCLTWYWVFRLYFIAICDSGTWRELRYNGCAFFLSWCRVQKQTLEVWKKVDCDSETQIAAALFVCYSFLL